MPKSNHRRPPRTAGHTRPARSPGHLGGRRAGRHGDLDHWFTKAEGAVAEWSKDMAHRGRQASRLVYKKRTPVSRHGNGRYVRVAGRGLVVVGRAAVGTAAVAVAGTYLTTRWTVRHSHRAYRAAKPHVVKVAGHAARYAHARGVVYGGDFHRRAVRMHARNRTRVRRMRYQAANRLDTLHTQSIIRDRPKIAMAAARCAAAVAPRTGRQHPVRQFGGFSTRSSVAGRRSEEQAIQRAKDALANTSGTPTSTTGGGSSPVGVLDNDPARKGSTGSGETPMVVPSAAEDAAIRRAREKLGDVDLGRTPTGDPDKEARKAGLPEATPGVWKTNFDAQEPPKRPTESAEDKRRRRDLETHQMLNPSGDVPGWQGPDMHWDYVSPPDPKDVERQRKAEQKSRPVKKAKAERLDATKNASGKSVSAPSKSISTTGGDMSNNPGAELNKAFALLADYTPEDYQDWMQMLISVAHAMRLGAEAVTVLAQRMDIQEGMDPRSLQKLYLAGPAIGAVMQLVAGTTKDFWILYQDRFETNGARGRTMADESRFFGRG